MSPSPLQWCQICTRFPQHYAAGPIAGVGYKPMLTNYSYFPVHFMEAYGGVEI